MAEAAYAASVIKKGKQMGNKANSHKKNKPENSSNATWIVLLFICIILFTTIVGTLIQRAISKKNAQDQYEELADQFNSVISTEGTELVEETENTEAGAQEEVAIPQKDIDWEALWKINEDVYAWIYIPGTKVDYPVVQHPTENDYYLNHNLDGSGPYPGCIYSQVEFNHKDFMDYNTVLYGHNMHDETMFQTLHYYEDLEFFEQNPYIYVYTPDETFVYEIFGAYQFSDAHLFYAYDQTTPLGFQNYLDEVFAIRDMNAHFREDVDVTYENHIITLSTCMQDAKYRYLVQGVLLNE